MIEIAAICLTIGAILYRNLGMSLFGIGLTVFSCALFGTVALRSRQGTFLSFLFAVTILLGALAVWRNEMPVHTPVVGNRAFDAKILATDRRLDKTILIITNDEGVRLQATLQQDSELLPGDIVTIRGSIAEPESFVTETGRLFDYPHYLESKGITALMNNPQIVLQEKGNWSPSRFASIVRFRIADIFSNYISFPTDGVIAGMLVGYQGGLPQSIKDLFRDTGVLHVLVLSGYNITLFAGFLMVLLKAVPFRLRTIITVCCIVLLVLVSGSGIASMRAGIMGSIALFAGITQRTYQPLRALAVAYMLFFFVSPLSIFADPGFHLSFLATGFMILVLPRIEILFHFLPTSHGINIRELLMLALTIPLFMLPYTMYFSGIVPLASPFANMVLAIITPLLMILGGCLLVISFVTPLAIVVGVCVSYLGDMVIWLLETMNKLPYWNTPSLSWWGVLMLYSIFLYLLFRREIIEYVSQLQSLLLPASSSSDS